MGWPNGKKRDIVFLTLECCRPGYLKKKEENLYPVLIFLDEQNFFYTMYNYVFEF